MAFQAAAARLVELLPPVDAENCTGRIAKLLEQLAAVRPGTIRPPLPLASQRTA